MAYPQTTFIHTTFLTTSFIRRRREVVYEKTILYQLKVLKETGRYDSFKLQWHTSYKDPPLVWPIPNHLFWDSDVAKWIEGACYFLQWKPNEEIDSAVKELTAMIRSAQQPDGYLNVHFTVVEPGKRFTNLRDLHELYNCGHLIEAALAHNQHYNNEDLLEPILKYVDLLYSTFGPGPEQKHGYPGHPEIELALLRLYERTRDSRHLALAGYFVEERGNPTGQNGRHYYDVEAEARGERKWQRPSYWPVARCYWYQQAHEPILRQKTIEGHSVRAMYLLTAIADLVRVEGSGHDNPKRETLERLFSNTVDSKMYLTGGIGAHKQWEGFGIDYFLPSGTDEGGCYAETCASIGVMMVAERLLQLDLDGKHGDIMELCFYNSVMSGMAINGVRFSYANQLASSETDLSKRAEWFVVACCPPNVTRLLGYIGGSLWTFKTEDARLQVNVHMYSSAILSVELGGNVVELEQKSNWPWEGKVEFMLRNVSNVSTTIKLRIPGWATDWQVSPEFHYSDVEKGYLTLSPEWLKVNSKFVLDIPLKARYISPHPYTNQDIIALARGPVVYCLEDIDNPWVDDHFKSLVLDPAGSISESTGSEAEMGEPFVALTAHNAASFLSVNERLAPHMASGCIALHRDEKAEQLHFIPYALRANREGGKGHMRVGIRRKR